MKTIHVAAAVIKKGNHIMIAQRLKGEFAGQWEFPGGKLEPGESASEALKRELMEEMELDIQVDKYLMTAEYDYPSFHLSMECFICSLINEDIHLHDHSAIQWIPIDKKIDHIHWVPADIQVMQAVQSLA